MNDVRLSRRRITAFSRAVGAIAAAYSDPYDAETLGYRDIIAPALYPYVLTQPYLNATFAQLAPEPALIVLHSIYVRCFTPLLAGQLYSILLRHKSRNSGDWTAVTCESAITLGGSQIAEIKASYGISRAKTLTRSNFTEADSDYSESQAEKSEALTPGNSQIQIPIGIRDIADFCAASGDYNPIHLDANAAQQLGLPGIIAPGLLVLGKALSQLEQQNSSAEQRPLMPQIIQARFLSPIHVSAVGTAIHAATTTSNSKIELILTQNANRVARATLTR